MGTGLPFLHTIVIDVIKQAPKHVEYKGMFHSYKVSARKQNIYRMRHLYHFNKFLTESVTKSFTDLVHENTYTINDSVYHGTALHSLYSILKTGLYGNKHGELNENNTVSTSVNSEMIHHFSDGHNTGLEYDLSGRRAFILPEWLRAILDTESGARTYDEHEEGDLIAHCITYKLPFKRSYDNEIVLPTNFLEDYLPKDYVGIIYGNTVSGNYGIRDEAEIAIIGHGIETLNKNLSCIYVDRHCFYDKDEVLEYLEETFSPDELRDPEGDDYVKENKTPSTKWAMLDKYSLA